MADFLQSNEQPLFYYIQFIFEKLTISNVDIINTLKRVFINTGSSKCLVCSDQQALNLLEWTQKSKNFNIGKSFVVDSKTSVMNIIIETSNGNFSGQIHINNVLNEKPTRQVIEIGKPNEFNELPSFQLQCIIFKRPLHFQASSIVNRPNATQLTNASQTNTVNQLSIGLQTENRVQFREIGVNSTNDHVDQSTQTTEVQSLNSHQRQIMMKMAILLINKVHARLLEYQMTRKIGSENMVSRQTNTDFTLPTTLTHTEVNNSVRVEHLQQIKSRLQELSNQHRQNLLNEQPKQLTRVKRLCRLKEAEKLVNTRIETPKSAVEARKTIEKEKVKDEKISERGSIKSWVSSLHSSASNPNLESTNKSSSLPKSEAKSEPKVPKLSTSISSQLSEESSDETSEDTESLTQSESSLSESESDEDEESESSIQEQIKGSTASSIPTELGSNASVSEKSYLESVASSSSSSAPKKNNVLSPTSEYLQKLRADVLKGRP